MKLPSANQVSKNHINLLFQPAHGNTNESEQKLSQICSVCDLNIEAGSFFEHLATAHSDPANETSPNQLNLKSTADISNGVSVKTTKSVSGLNSKRRKNPKSNVSRASHGIKKCHEGRKADKSNSKNKSSQKDNLRRESLTLEKMLLLCNIKTCKINLTRCDDVANFEGKTVNENSLERKKVKEKLSKRTPRSKIRSTGSKNRRDVYFCPFPGCGKKFSFKNNMKIHFNLHSGKKLFKCEICNKRFAYSGNLTVHKRIHTGDKPFECKVCSKRFSVSSNLTNHEVIHTGENPFKCPYCSKRCRVVSNIMQHVKRMHGKVWKASLNSQEGKNKETNTKVNSTENKNKSAEIKVKGQSLKVESTSESQTQIKKINRKRGGPSKNLCTKCGKAFSKPFNLKRHMKTMHKEEKKSAEAMESKEELTKKPEITPQVKVGQEINDAAYACLVCPKKAGTIKCLEAHMKEVHGLELAAKFDRNLLRCKRQNK